jgi:outer membrane protein assembly factor BamB
MTITQTDESIQQKPLRLWPGVLIVVIQWLVRFVVPLIIPKALIYGVLGGVVGGLAIVVWWAFFSRAPRIERWGAVLVMIAAVLATPLVLHESVANGMMGLMFAIYAIPGISLAFVLGVVVSRRFSDRTRRVVMVASILLACAIWTLVRTGGITGSADSDLAWRWSQTPEERLLAQTGDEPTALPSPPAAAETGANWPGFRGADRDGVVRGARLETNWSASPPVELWRRPIGPGWSSFAVRGDLLYTQEQRGNNEVVACYKTTSGQPVWTHRDAARFYESNGGAGPRGTPTFHNGRLYTLGATGILNALNATDGSVVWSRNAASDTKAALPGWGFAGSPLVIDDMVIVATAGSLAAYDIASGEPRWFGPQGGGGYSSPHRVKIDGITQIVLMGETGVIGVAPADGTRLWEHPWKGTPIIQPALTADGNLLVIEGDGSDLRRIAVAHESGNWTVKERWTSYGLRPNFNDLVVHNGYAFGFDGGVLACIDVENGEQKWDGGGYGYGQLVLLPDQDLLLVISEKGDLALVKAAPDQFTELARFPAIKGKTWNHPVLVGDVLLVRNGQEMAAFRLPVTAR